MTMWRIWHVRNEITHRKNPPPAEASCRFLHGYINSLLCIRQHPSADIVKGKTVVHLERSAATQIKHSGDEKRWMPPAVGLAKLNTDGSYIPTTGAAGGGMVLRGATGEVIYTACRQLRTCANGLEAELAACSEGLALALHRTELPVVIEMDSLEAVSMLNSPSVNHSNHRVLVQEILGLIADDPRKISISHISRSQNTVSHALAAYGRSTPRTAVWLGSGLHDIVNLCMAERPP
ncbi:hypothetical protein ACQJBY_059648 [Aegilops geniculata]